MTGRSAAHRKLIAIVDAEPEWAFPAMNRYFERHRDGDTGDASYELSDGRIAEAKILRFSGSRHCEINKA